MDKILDTAGQKGTGKWTVISSLELGMPITLIGEAVFARCLSALKDERVAAVEDSERPEAAAISGDRKAFIEDVRRALYCSKIISYAQGYMLMREAAKEYKWNLNYGGIALMWRGGCIIRSRFLGKIKEAFDKNPKLTNLLLDDFFSNDAQRIPGLLAARDRPARSKHGIPTPAFTTALAFYDGYRTRAAAREPAAGPARLLRRPHLRAHRQAARRVLPHQLDRPRRPRRLRAPTTFKQPIYRTIEHEVTV